MLLSPSGFPSRSAIRPRNLPSSPSRLGRGYYRAPRGADAACEDIQSIQRQWPWKFSYSGSATFAAAAGQAAWRRSASIVSAHLAGKIISVVTVTAPDRHAAVAVARAVVCDVLNRQAL